MRADQSAVGAVNRPLRPVGEDLATYKQFIHSQGYVELRKNVICTILGKVIVQ